MSNNHLQPVIDLYPFPNGLGFRKAEDWWIYVSKQNEEDKVDMLITLAHLSETICQLLLAHDQMLFDKFHLSSLTIERLCTIDADCLTVFAAAILKG